MPIYEFRCHKCGHRFEKLCSMDESGAKMECPACSAPAPKRVMSGFCKKGSEDPVTGIGGGGGGGCSTCSSSNCSTCGH